MNVYEGKAAQQLGNIASEVKKKSRFYATLHYKKKKEFILKLIILFYISKTDLHSI